MSHRKRRSNHKEIISLALELMKYLRELPEHIPKSALNEPARRILEEIAEFTGGLCGRALFTSAHKEGYAEAYIESMRSILAVLQTMLLHAKTGCPVSIRPEDREMLISVAKKIYTPKAFEMFSNSVANPMNAPLDVFYILFSIARDSLIYQIMGETSGNVPRGFCPACPAMNIAKDMIPKIDGILHPPVNGRRIATGIESLANFPSVPVDKRDSLVSLAIELRDFIELKGSVDDYENKDELLAHASMKYACALIESAALVHQGYFSSDDVARVFSFSVDEVQKLVDSEDMKKYIEHVY